MAENALLPEGTAAGEGLVAAADVKIGRGCEIGNYVVLHAGTVIGDNVRIDDFAVIGKRPLRAANSAASEAADEPLPGARIGSGCLIGTHAVVYAGAEIAPNCLLADFATVREHVRVGDKTIVGRGVCIEDHVTVGALCKLETNAYLTAYSALEDRCFVAPGVVTSNDNAAGRGKDRFRHFRGITLRRGGRLGAGAVVLPGREIGSEGFAAAGSVVTHDVPPGEIVAGVPARRLRRVPPEQLLPEKESFSAEKE